MEAAILAAEETLARCQQGASDPAIAPRAAELAVRRRVLDAARDAVAQLFARWAALETKRGAS